MTDFRAKLGSGKFLVTAELNPPKGIDAHQVLQTSEQIGGVIDAYNITDSHSSIMTMAPISLAHLLIGKGIDPIVQMTGRDRNRIAIQADMLSAYVLGVRNILCMTGDPPSNGDHPEAKSVFDLDGIGLVNAANALMNGHDLAGNPLNESPSFCIGATVNPGASDLSKEIHRMEQKFEAGAVFFQSQAIFDSETLYKFAERTQHITVPIIAGVIVLKSSRMAHTLNQRLPDIRIPDAVVRDMERTNDRQKQGITVAARIIQDIKEMVRGVHIMAIKWEKHIPQILEESGLIGNP